MKRPPLPKTSHARDFAEVVLDLQIATAKYFQIRSAGNSLSAASIAEYIERLAKELTSMHSRPQRDPALNGSPANQALEPSYIAEAANG